MKTTDKSADALTDETRATLSAAADVLETDGMVPARDELAKKVRAILAASPVEQHEAAPSGMPSPIWWINHGTHGQITTRPDEAERAREVGSSVHKYHAAAQPEPPVADERAAFVEIRKKIELIKGGAEHWPGGWSGTIGACDDVLAELDRASSPNATGAEGAIYQIRTMDGTWLDVPREYYEKTKSDASLTRAVYLAPAQSAEPGTWQYRPIINGKPYPWIECTKEAAERLRSDDYVETHEVRDLFASPRPAPIPTGYALVPVEPTQAMVDAWNTSGADDFKIPDYRDSEFMQEQWEEWARANARKDWCAMLTAAPPPPAPASAPVGLTDAARDVLAERRRQVEREGWAPAHDDEHADGQMAAAGGCYALASAFPFERDLGHGHKPLYWPWDPSWWKPTTGRRNLVKAGALILAEIERLDRALLKGNKHE